MASESTTGRCSLGCKFKYAAQVCATQPGQTGRTTLCSVLLPADPIRAAPYQCLSGLDDEPMSSSSPLLSPALELEAKVKESK